MDLSINRVLDPENMTCAWEEVARGGGAAGLDGVTIRRWRRTWEERLINLAQAVRANRYNPHPLRRFTIPKRSGGVRHLTIPTVTDRVLQRAVLRVLDDHFDAQFLDCSFGYRAGLGLRQAVQQIVYLRDQGLQWVLDADVDECFDSIDHATLISCLRQHIRDAIILRLIRQWLETGRLDPQIPRGIPLGNVISPLLCNIYLHHLDQGLVWSGLSPVRYADDFCVFCVNESEAERAWHVAARELRWLKLELEPSKTNITHFNQGFDYLGIHFERNTYSFMANNKRIEIQGDFDDRIFYDYAPNGYV